MATKPKYAQIDLETSQTCTLYFKVLVHFCRPYQCLEGNSVE